MKKLNELLPTNAGKYTATYNLNFYTVVVPIAILVANFVFFNSWIYASTSLIFIALGLNIETVYEKRQWIIDTLKEGLTELQEVEFKKDLPEDMQHMAIEDFGCVIKHVTVISNDNEITVNSMITVIDTGLDDDDDDSYDYPPIDDNDLGGRSKIRG